MARVKALYSRLFDHVVKCVNRALRIKTAATGQTMQVHSRWWGGGCACAFALARTCAHACVRVCMHVHMDAVVRVCARACMHACVACVCM